MKDTIAKRAQLPKTIIDEKGKERRNPEHIATHLHGTDRQVEQASLVATEDGRERPPLSRKARRLPHALRSRQALQVVEGDRAAAIPSIVSAPSAATRTETAVERYSTDAFHEMRQSLGRVVEMAPLARWGQPAPRTDCCEKVL